ncbi:MAG: chloride channel protein [Candidatus Omnitrophica bacterium]|nr:chloride channel protein [Candidatus Omnitrophota bacterium]
MSAILLIGTFGGVAGAAFSTALLEGKRKISRWRGPLARYGVPVVLSWGVLAVAAIAGTRVLGPGNQAAHALVDGQYPNWVAAFPLWKMAATLLTYWSGIAGGIFAPCLSMGSALGSWLGHELGAPVAGCALIGMAAFLSGAIQAPITAFVIIFEMTGHHQFLLLPIMLASLLAFMVARIFGAKHLYQALAEYYQPLLGPTH